MMAALSLRNKKYVNHDHRLKISMPYLTTIAGPWYFGRVVVPQRLINLSLYHEILLLQKFNDTGGKVLKPQKNQNNLLCAIVFDLLIV